MPPSEGAWYHMIQLGDVDADLEARFSNFRGVIVNPALEPVVIREIKTRLTSVKVLASDVNAVRLPLPPDGNVSPFPYVREIAATFPPSALWRYYCTGNLVSTNGQGVNYSLTQAAIGWWQDRMVARAGRPEHGVYIDDAAREWPQWLIEDLRRLRGIDGNGDDWPERVEELAAIYRDGADPLIAALRSVYGGILIANTGLPRINPLLNGITIELSGLGPPDTAAVAAYDAIAAQLRIGRLPRIGIAWCKTREEVDAWRRVVAARPPIPGMMIGQESGGVEIIPGSQR